MRASDKYHREMLIEPFSVGMLNKHYEGTYSEAELLWRRLGAADKVSNLQRLLGSRIVETVLEVGCGTGSVLAEIVRRGIGQEHIGVDMADPAEHLDPAASNLVLRQYDGEHLPFSDRSFDLVVASHVIEHVPNPRQFIKELTRVSKQLLYFEVPCEVRAVARREPIQRSLSIGHVNGYTPEYFMILLQTSALRVLDLELFDHSRDVHNFNTRKWVAATRMLFRRTMLRINPLLASRVFCYHCGALCDDQVGAA